MRMPIRLGLPLDCYFLRVDNIEICGASNTVINTVAGQDVSPAATARHGL
jgi:hypothetical protein